MELGDSSKTALLLQNYFTTLKRLYNFEPTSSLRHAESHAAVHSNSVCFDLEDSEWDASNDSNQRNQCSLEPSLAHRLYQERKPAKRAVIRTKCLTAAHPRSTDC
jgi:hypothetical protein